MSDKSNIRAGSNERVTPSNKQGSFPLKIDSDSVIGSKNTLFYLIYPLFCQNPSWKNMFVPLLIYLSTIRDQLHSTR
ncbi:hypothetical protein H3T52_00720 [Commensalibacter sp. M0402]|uniref:hypothetical protein n=1 Tax=Commensalibacter TaxID=1079922 RepID=UPI0018DBEA01|nr:MULTISPECIES: hypothetical protein [Commensalibacter]MBI0082634.1 hypothetical protein [Commensalibacter sp. W6292M3]MBI0087474.1 hypothetical protein [Commensalibacter melissae]